jgi:hypothetical protein
LLLPDEFDAGVGTGINDGAKVKDVFCGGVVAGCKEGTTVGSSDTLWFVVEAGCKGGSDGEIAGAAPVVGALVAFVSAGSMP